MSLIDIEWKVVELSGWNFIDLFLKLYYSFKKYLIHVFLNDLNVLILK
jgi:hypothetical protein